MEVSLFGPGVGECVLVKLPTNKWLVVDSFIDRDSKKPIALKYLEDLNIDASADVELIVITHWHRDHIAGISEVIDTCSNATVVLPEAFTTNEYTSFICALAKDRVLEDLNSGIELKKALKSIQAHYNINKKAPLLAKEGQSLFKDHVTGLEIEALSPSPHSVIASNIEVQNLYDRFKTSNPRLHILKQNPNNNSIALLVKVNDISVLLGGDLEEPKSNPDQLYGWSAILKSTILTKNKSILFKVPHHGSPSAHHDDVWKYLVTKDPYSILTTYDSSSLPSNDDIERINQRSKVVCLTTPPKLTTSKIRDKKLQRQIEQFCKGLTQRFRKTGHIKINIDCSDGSIQVDKENNKMIVLKSEPPSNVVID